MLHPNSLFSKYRDKIIDLKQVDQNSILTSHFLLEEDSDIKIYYAPHKEFVNEKAKVMIVGITPGWSQTQRAYQTAISMIKTQHTDEQVCFQCKVDSRFAGTMRSNLINMLDELKLYEIYNLTSCSELFASGCDLLHTTSVIKYPCFYKGKNYSGYTPAIKSKKIFEKYILNEFMSEVNIIEDLDLIIPLGAAVEKILMSDVQPYISCNCKILKGFPHPSGLNAHRKSQFDENYASMMEMINELKINRNYCLDKEST